VLLATGSLQLATGKWQLAAGSLKLATGSLQLAAGNLQLTDQSKLCVTYEITDHQNKYIPAND